MSRCGAYRMRSRTGLWSCLQQQSEWEYWSACRSSAIRDKASNGNASLAPLGTAFEKQGLAGDGGNRCRLERLCDQEGRLRPFSGEEALGVRGDENYRGLEGGQQLIDRFKSRAAIGE